jgi:SepF-like predicted cell division protein (DUF552 family)
MLNSKIKLLSKNNDASDAKKQIYQQEKLILKLENINNIQDIEITKLMADSWLYAPNMAA